MDVDNCFCNFLGSIPPKKPSLDFTKLLYHVGNEIRNFNYAGKNLDAIVSKCCTLKNLHLAGCMAVTDELFLDLCPIQTVRENLLNLNIYGTSVTPEMAAVVFYSLPCLQTFVYHDIAGFLHYADINVEKPDDDFVRKRVCKLQLGMVHETSIHLTFSNCDAKNLHNLKELELYLPAGVSRRNTKNNIFQFKPDKIGMYDFVDIYKAIMAVKPEKIFGGYSAGYHLTKMSFFSVKNIDLDLIFSTMKHLKKIILHSCITKINYFLDDKKICPESANMNLYHSRSIVSLYLCNVMSDDVVRILRLCPNLKELYLYDLEVTQEMFDLMDKAIKVSMKNCSGCPFLQTLYRLKIPRYIAQFQECIYLKDFQITFRQFCIFFALILPVYLFVFIFKYKRPDTSVCFV